MKTKNLYFAGTIIALFVFSAVSYQNCETGGGGGGGGTTTLVGNYSNASVSGPYALMNLRFDRGTNQGTIPLNISAVPYSGNFLQNPMRGGAISIGTINFDGAGNYSISSTQNEDGTLSPKSNSGSYSIASDGSLSAGNVVGQVASDGGGFVVANISSNSQEIAFGFKKVNQTFSNASLNGSYAIIGWHYRSNNPTTPFSLVINSVPFMQTFQQQVPAGISASWGVVTFDGAGNVSGNIKDNDEGVITSKSVSATYSVASDGTLTVQGMTGQVAANGNGFQFMNSTSEPEMVIAFKIGAGFNNSSLNGSYALAGFHFEPGMSQPNIGVNVPSVPFSMPLNQQPPNGFSSQFGTIKFDGAGNYSLTATNNQDGTISSHSDSGTYSISDNGSGSASNVSIQLGPNGLWFMAFGNSKPEITFGVKK